MSMSTNANAILHHNLKLLLSLQQAETESLEACALRIEDVIQRFKGLAAGGGVLIMDTGGDISSAATEHGVIDENDYPRSVRKIDEAMAVIVAINGLNERNGVQKRELTQLVDRDESSLPRSRQELFASS